jgi:hypothetical protein
MSLLSTWLRYPCRHEQILCLTDAGGPPLPPHPLLLASKWAAVRYQQVYFLERGQILHQL